MDKLPVQHHDGPARRAHDVDGPTPRSPARLESNGRPCHTVEIRVATVATGSLSAGGKDSVEDGTKVGGARSSARTSRRQNRGNQGPCRVGQVGVVESSTHRNGPFGPDQRSFKTDVNFSNTLSITSWNRITGPSNAGCVQASIFAPSGELGARSPATKRFI